MQGCSTTKQATQNDLDGHWVLKTLNGKDAKSLFERNLPTLKFDFKEKIVSGTGGCNRYTGRFVMINNLLSTPNIASTRMMCIFPNAESEFFAVFEKDNRLTIKDGILRFQDGSKVVMEFVRGEEEPAFTSQQLAGTWKLTKIENQTVTEVFQGDGARIPDMTFDLENRKITGLAGCNRFNTTYILTDNIINISPAVTTRMACPNLQGEAKFLQNLRGELQISMPDSSTLRLVKDNEVVLEFKKEGVATHMADF